MRRKKRLNWKVILIVLIVFLLWSLFISKYNWIRILKNEVRIAKKRLQIKDYEQEKRDLKIEKEKLEKEDKNTIEKKARELGLTKPGEKIIRIINQERKEE